MRRQIDVLLWGIFLAAALALGAPVGSASFQFTGLLRPSFPESYLITAARFPTTPAPETFHRLQKSGLLVTGLYTVGPSDTLSSIAKKYSTGADFLRSTNRLNSVNLIPGRRIKVHNGDGMVYRVREVKGKPESLQAIAAYFSRQAGRRITPEELARVNRLPAAAFLSEGWLAPGSPLFIPGAHLRFTDYLVPVDWARGKRLISSNYGSRWHPILKYRKFHSGLDMPRPHGSPVKASRDGVVVFSDWREGYGRLIIIRHGDGIRTWYGHLSEIRVAPGQRLRAGHVIGKVGSTGLSTGPHLHFEVRNKYGKAMNPRKYLF